MVDKGTILAGLHCMCTRKMDLWKNVVWVHIELEAKEKQLSSLHGKYKLQEMLIAMKMFRGYHHALCVGIKTVFVYCFLYHL